MTELVATIVTHPERSDLSDSHIEEVERQFRSAGGTIIKSLWLDKYVAFDCVFRNMPLDTARSLLDALRMPFDCVVQPLKNRRKKLFLADMDSTMIQMESLDVLAEEFGIGKEIAEITERSMRGELDFETSLRERVSLLKGKLASTMDMIHRQIQYMSGAETLLRVLRKNNVYTALVTGGFTTTAEIVSKHLNFHEYHANVLSVEDGQFTGEVERPISGPDAKLESLNRLCRKLGIRPEDAVTIGDGANDIPMHQASGMGVAYYGKPIVCEATKFHINHSNLLALLYFQGYSNIQ